MATEVGEAGRSSQKVTELKRRLEGLGLDKKGSPRPCVPRLASHVVLLAIHVRVKYTSIVAVLHATFRWSTKERGPGTPAAHQA